MKNNDLFVGPAQAATILGFSHPNAATHYLDQIGFEVKRTPGRWRRYSLLKLMELKETLDSQEYRVKEFYVKKEVADGNLGRSEEAL